MNGVKIGNKHTYDDFGLILSNKVINPPSPQLKLVSVPLRDGSIDLTSSLMDDVKYNDRIITMTFSVVDPLSEWTSKISEIQNYLHGQKMKIIFDDDIAFYYLGRLAVTEWTHEKNVGILTIEAICEPYKYDLISSAAEWEWDPFDFDNGIINEGGDITIDGETTLYFIGRRKKSYPIITSDSAMTVTFDGETFDLIQGVNKIYDIILLEGANQLTFRGNGTVTIDYIGGSL